MCIELHQIIVVASNNNLLVITFPFKNYLIRPAIYINTIQNILGCIPINFFKKI
jgi:hypothetical protein